MKRKYQHMAIFLFTLSATILCSCGKSDKGAGDDESMSTASDDTAKQDTVSSDTLSDSATNSDNNPGTESATDTGTSPDNDSASDSVTGTGSDSSYDSFPDTGSDGSSDSATVTGSDNTSDSVTDAGDDTSSDSVTDTGSDITSDSATDTGSDTASDTVTATETDPIALTVDEIESTWVTIPSGRFIYGSPETQPCRGPSSEAQVEVIITRSYKMSATEITRKQWGMTGFPDPSNASPCDDCAQGLVSWTDVLAWLNALSTAAGLPECYDLSNCTGTAAMGCPNGDVAEPFCVAASVDTETFPALFQCDYDVHRYPARVDCPGYRLPTIAEWEWAARGGTTTATYVGDIVGDTSISGCQPDPIMDQVAWHLCNAGEPGGTALRQVGQLLPNAYGLYDILGNALEWVDNIDTSSGLEVDTGQAPPLVDPVGRTEETETGWRTLRGGSVVSSPCRSTCTNNSYGNDEERAHYHGFRPVRTILE